MEKTQFSFSIDPNEKKSLEEAAKEMEMTLTELLKTGASFYASLDPTFRKWIKQFSSDLNIKEYMILQNLAISWVARREAEGEVLGCQDPLLDEFQITDRGPVTGEELHQVLKRKFIREFEKEKEKKLQKEAQYGVLSKEETESLKGRMDLHRQRKEAGESAKKARAEGRAYSFSENEDEKTILAEMRAKRQKAGIK